MSFNDHAWNPPTDAERDAMAAEYMKGDRLLMGYKAQLRITHTNTLLTWK